MRLPLSLTKLTVIKYNPIRHPLILCEEMACALRGRVGLRGIAARAFRHASTGRFKPVVSRASASSFPITSIAGASRPLPPSSYCISTATASRGYGTDGEAGRIYRSLESSPDGKKLCVSWADGEESTYHAVWLRHNCRCPQCWDDRNAAPLVYFDSLRNVEIKAADLSGEQISEAMYVMGARGVSSWSVWYLKY